MKFTTPFIATQAAKRLLRYALLLGVAVVTIANTGCSRISEYCNELTLHSMTRQAQRGYELPKCVGPAEAHHYKCGWREGYYSVATGGDGSPPLVPPKKYWKLKRTDAACSNWYRGYSDGACVAHKEGVQSRYYVPVSCCRGGRAISCGECITQSCPTCRQVGPEPVVPEAIANPEPVEEETNIQQEEELPDGQINNTLKILPAVADWDFSDAQKFHSTNIWIEELSLLVNGVTQTTSEASPTAVQKNTEIRSGLVFTEVEQASFEQLDNSPQPALQTELFLPSPTLGLRDFEVAEKTLTAPTNRKMEIELDFSQLVNSRIAEGMPSCDVTPVR